MRLIRTAPSGEKQVLWLKMLDPRDISISDALLELVPNVLIFECTILPTAVDDNVITLLCCHDDPEFQRTETERLEFLLGRRINWLPIDRDTLERLIYDRFPLAHAEIQNCEPRFSFRCPRTWDSLTKTEDAKIRNCESCSRSVTWTDDRQMAKRLGANGQCVAFSDARAAETLGMIDAD